MRRRAGHVLDTQFEKVLDEISGCHVEIAWVDATPVVKTGYRDRSRQVRRQLCAL
jgi:hypothetical protein